MTVRNGNWEGVLKSKRCLLFLMHRSVFALRSFMFCVFFSLYMALHNKKVKKYNCHNQSLLKIHKKLKA